MINSNSHQQRSTFTRRARSLGCVVGMLYACSSAVAQGTGPTDPRTISFDERLEGWRARHGSSWQAVYEPQTGYARFLYGGGAAAPFVPAKDDEFFVLARMALEDARELHGVDAATLQEDTVSFLPLGLAGTTDKLSVQFRQAVRGVRVVQGFVNVLFDTGGRLLSIDVTGLPGMADHSTAPTIPADAALATALARFSADTGLAATRTDAPELVIDQIQVLGRRKPRLAWNVEVHAEPASARPQGFAYFVDAADGRILRREDRVHEFDVTGTVSSMASPGLLPDANFNAETSQVMPHLRVVYDNILGFDIYADTNQSGNFTIPSPYINPIDVDVRFAGPYCKLTNDQTNTYFLNQNLPNSSGNGVPMNSSSVDFKFYTPEANVFLWVNKLWDWIHAVNPSDSIPAFQALARVNENSLTCNAAFTGSSLIFARAAACLDDKGQPTGETGRNAAYSTIVVHEMGHWWNVKYQSGNGPDGFGEGNADTFAMYLTDQHLVGEDFIVGESAIRSGLNNKQYWGDSSTCPWMDPNADPPGSIPEVHACGEVLMGALWKVRARLKTSLGATDGAVIADELFNSWMNGYNDTQIKSIIEAHWLTLDDDDMNLSNGTPHFLDIDIGFRQQGFPGAGSQVATVYVDAANMSAPWAGTQADPFRFVEDAAQYVTPGGSIMIAGGTYSESPTTINQNVTLRSTGGEVTLR